jgi:hypothetical protein
MDIVLKNVLQVLGLHRATRKNIAALTNPSSHKCLLIFKNMIISRFRGSKDLRIRVSTNLAALKNLSTSFEVGGIKLKLMYADVTVAERAFLNAY